MRQIHYPRIGETVTEAILPNGLRVRVLYKPEFVRTYAVLAVNYGSADLEYLRDGVRVCPPAGTAHFLEHKMFDLPEGNAMQAFPELGGSPNAFTSYTMTAYYVQTTERPAENLRLLLRMVLTPYFTEESVEKERGIIAQEIKMYADNPDSRLYELLSESARPGHPLSVPIAGSVESIGEITAQTLRQCYADFYRPENMILCVEGNLSPEEVLAQAAAVEAPASAGEIRSLFSEAKAGPALRGEQRTMMDVAMPMFALGIPLPDTDSADIRMEIIADLAMDVLVGESTPLYRRLYEEGLIDSGFSVGYEGFRCKAMLAAAGDSRDPAAVAAAIFDEAERLVGEGICPEDLSRLKKAMLGRKLRGLDSFAGTCVRLCEACFDGQDLLHFPEQIDSVTEAEVLERLRRFDRNDATLVIIAPKEESACFIP